VESTCATGALQNKMALHRRMVLRGTESLRTKRPPSPIIRTWWRTLVMPSPSICDIGRVGRFPECFIAHRLPVLIEHQLRTLANPDR
jgi:hypothetical protein